MTEDANRAEASELRARLAAVRAVVDEWATADPNAPSYDLWNQVRAVLPSPNVGTLDDEICHRCGGENVRWSAPSPLWNKVMRGNDINGEPRYGDLVCIRCFIVLAFEAGIDGTWRVGLDPEPEGMIYETPSGRVWDQVRGLWVEPRGETCGDEARGETCCLHLNHKSPHASASGCHWRNVSPGDMDYICRHGKYAYEHGCDDHLDHAHALTISAISPEREA